MTIDQAFAAALKLQQAGRPAEAESAYREILTEHSERPEVHYNLGVVLRAQGRLRDAANAYERAIELRSHFPEAINNLAETFESMGELDNAEDWFRHGLLLNPQSASGWSNLGGVLKDLGRLDESIECLDRALTLEPNNARIRNNRIFTLHYSAKFDAAALGEAAGEWGRRHAAPTPALNSSPPRPPLLNRRLRVGYVSSYFREHCQAFFLVPLFRHHDPRAVEIVVYHDSSIDDAVTKELKSFATVWHSVAGMNDQAVADLVQQDRIDVLVDLTLHMAENRLGVFAKKPAPVQITWLGYPGTTGVRAIDFRISDPYLDPVGTKMYYTEKTLRLPDSFWCYDPLTIEAAVSPPPSSASGKITFGCLNNFCKVTDQTLDLWSQVLRQLPDSRLLLLAPSGATRVRVKTKLGLTSDRIEFVAYQPRTDYLKLYQRIDVCLDTFPYNGHTTSLDTLWSGVPVVSLCGSTAVSRAGLSLMSNLGLDELVATTPADFVRIATELAQDKTRVAELRAMLHERMRRSPLMDAPRFARSLENAYRKAWQSME